MDLVGVGRRVRDRRESLGIRQDELAERANLSRGYVSRLENGKAGDGLEELLRIAHVLGMRISEIAGETEEELTAEVRRQLPDGGVVALRFQRLARGLANGSASDREFLERQLAALDERFGTPGETDEGP